MKSTMELAQEQQVSPSYITKLALMGKMPARKVGRNWFFSESDEAEYVSLPEAARRLDLSYTRVTQLRAAGRLPARRVGAQWFVALADLTHFANTARPAGRRRVRPARS